MEEASPVGISFLDVDFFFDAPANRISFSPCLKPSALTSILGFDSAHPGAVHGAWLKAYLFRMRKRSSTMEWFLAFKGEVFRRLAECGVDRTILAALDVETTFTYPIPRIQPPMVRGRVPTLRVVLPFRPMWCKDLQRVCAMLSPALRKLDEPGLAVLQRLSISWTLHSPALGGIVLKY